MKIIISHDVDHLYRSEHLLDGTLLKYSTRAVTEALSGVLTARELTLRLADLFHKQWHHIDELMDFDKANGIPSTFFFAMTKGKGLNYSQSEAEPIIKRVIERGFDAGVHGIDFENQDQIKAEYQRFKTVSELSNLGIRMHYLRMNDGTLEKLNQAGYLFDSSEFAYKAPYRIGNMTEFPLLIMDSHEFYGGKSWQTEKIDRIIEKTKNRIAELADGNYQFLTLLFHDRYFCSSYESYKGWYMKIIGYLKENGHSFIGFSEAAKEIS